MSAIQQALVQLEQSIHKLEGSAHKVGTIISQARANAQNQSGQQPDMFSAPVNQNGSAVSKQDVTARLDQAIETVESMLENA